MLYLSDRQKFLRVITFLPGRDVEKGYFQNLLAEIWITTFISESNQVASTEIHVNIYFNPIIPLLKDYPTEIRVLQVNMNVKDDGRLPAVSSPHVLMPWPHWPPVWLPADSMHVSLPESIAGACLATVTKVLGRPHSFRGPPSNHCCELA